MIKLKRIYEDWSKEDGFRVLVDRLWPRGMSKTRARLDLWLKDMGPSTELRKWFNHDPNKWEEFKRKYIIELKDNSSVEILKGIIKKEKIVTLLYAAKDVEHNEAIVIKEFLGK